MIWYLWCIGWTFLEDSSRPGRVVDHHFGVDSEDYHMISIMLSWLANRWENREYWGTYRGCWVQICIFDATMLDEQLDRKDYSGLYFIVIFLDINHCWGQWRYILERWQGNKINRFFDKRFILMTSFLSTQWLSLPPFWPFWPLCEPYDPLQSPPARKKIIDYFC